MNKYFIFLLLTCFTHSMMGQTEERNTTVLQGRTGPQVLRIFPFITDNDTTLKNSKYPILYPLLVVNNVQIKDVEMVDCFRNNFDRTKIKKIKRISKEKAEKKGIPNVPKDGVLFVTTKKNYDFDFTCK